MRTAFIVVKHDGLEGRFMVGQWDAEEIARTDPDSRYSLLFLEACGWGSAERWTTTQTDYALVMEVNRQPVEGSIFGIGGDPIYDLTEREMPRFGLGRMWVAFLTWLYANLYSDGRGPGQTSLADLPALIDLDAALPSNAARKEALME